MKFDETKIKNLIRALVRNLIGVHITNTFSSLREHFPFTDKTELFELIADEINSIVKECVDNDEQEDDLL